MHTNHPAVIDTSVLFPVMRKYDAQLTLRPHDFLNEAFGWFARLELRDREAIVAEGDEPGAALRNLVRKVHEAGLASSSCPRCGGRQLADGVCADSACDAKDLNRGWRLDRY